MKIPLCPARLCACLLCFTAVATRSAAEIVDYLTPVADTALRENQPNDNFGAAASLPVGVSGSGYPGNRALFRFDLSRLPADAVFSSVRLRLLVTQAGATSPAVTYELRRALTNWNEGAKPGLAATFGEATWTARAHLQSAWTVGGGLAGVDYSASASSTAVLGSAGAAADFSGPGLTADVAFWTTNRSGNFGWVLLAQGEAAGTGKQVGAREHPAASPLLEVRYTSFSIYNLQRSGNAVRFSFDAAANQTYAVEYRDAIAGSGPWSVLTNIPALGGDTTVHITNTTTATPRFYRLRKP
jgi:hypothetical protein